MTCGPRHVAHRGRAECRFGAASWFPKRTARAHIDSVASVFHAELRPDVAQLASLRRSLADWLAQEDVEPGASDAIILATHEAVANAVEHARSEVAVTGSRQSERLTMVIRNSGGWKESDGSEYRGRGLILMRGLMSQVEIQTHPHGSVLRMHLLL